MIYIVTTCQAQHRVLYSCNIIYYYPGQKKIESAHVAIEQFSSYRDRHPSVIYFHHCSCKTVAEPVGCTLPVFVDMANLTSSAPPGSGIVFSAAHTRRRRVISRACTRLCLACVPVSIFLAMAVDLLMVLPWPKKLRQARTPNIGACMLDTDHAPVPPARARVVVSIFLARVVLHPSKT